MIPEAAVEAAARAIYSVSRSVFDPGGGFSDEWATWEQASDGKRAQDRKEARAALEAAAPHMLADARFEAWEEGMSYALPGTQRGIETFDAMRKSNPYRNAK